MTTTKTITPKGQLTKAESYSIGIRTGNKNIIQNIKESVLQRFNIYLDCNAYETEAYFDGMSKEVVDWVVGISPMYGASCGKIHKEN